MNCSHVFDYIELFRIITTEELMQRTVILYIATSYVLSCLSKGTRWNVQWSTNKIMKKDISCPRAVCSPRVLISQVFRENEP